MNNHTPMAVWRAGMDKIEAVAQAVDMLLRLDNANVAQIRAAMAEITEKSGLRVIRRTRVDDLTP
jgi:hypothetical protein